MSGVKHRLKGILREGWARLLFHSGLHRLVGALMPRRLLILAGHCVEHPECNGSLPRDMKISRAKLGRILGWLGRHYELCTVGAGFERLQEGAGKSLVALTMDDGYRDNVEALLPLLRELGAPATIYVESRALDERRVNWLHEYFWLLERLRPEELVAEYAALSRDKPLNDLLREALAAGGDLTQRAKRHLKYDADPAERERAIDALFAAHGGDGGALCERLYMTWDGARRLQAAGIEIGGHTVHHHVLATLPAEEQRREVAAGREAVRAALGGEVKSFAYPFGRRWDFDAHSCEAVRAAGFETAVTTHAGTNGRAADPLRLRRWMIDEGARLHLIAAEACGGFDLLRKVGLDLSE